MKIGEVCGGWICRHLLVLLLMLLLLLSAVSCGWFVARAAVCIVVAAAAVVGDGCAVVLVRWGSGSAVIELATAVSVVMIDGNCNFW